MPSMKNNRIIKLTALLLTVVGILALLPSEALATWVIRRNSAGTKVQSTQGDVTVNYKFFGEDMYVPPEGSKTYYAYDAIATNYMGATGVDDLSKLGLTSQSYSQKTVDANGNSTLTSKTDSKGYCPSSHTLGDCGYKTKESHTFSETITLDQFVYTPVSTTLPTWSLNETICLYDYRSEGWSRSDYTTQKGTIVDTISTESNYNNVEGATRTIKVCIEYTYTPTVSVSISTATGSHRFPITATTHYICTGTPTVTFTGSYKIYVVEEIGVPEYVAKDLLVPVSHGATLYSESGYTTGDSIYAPAYSTLYACLPTEIQENTKTVQAVEGIGENAATLIKIMSSAWRRYALGDDKVTFVYDTLEKVGEYAVKLYVGVSVEKVYAMLFDNKMKLLDTIMLAEGAVNSVRVSARTIIDKAIKKNAAAVILIHNHPNGNPYPSSEDERFSSYLKELFSTLDINLIDHVIVSGRFYRPVFEGELGENKLASKNTFSYGKASLANGVRVFELKVASSIPYETDVK